MLRTLFGDPDRYVNQYWKKMDGKYVYISGDSAKKGKDGYIWMLGRIDEVLNISISGHRLGTAELESVLID